MSQIGSQYFPANLAGTPWGYAKLRDSSDQVQTRPATQAEIRVTCGLLRKHVNQRKQSSNPLDDNNGKYPETSGPSDRDIIEGEPVFRYDHLVTKSGTSMGKTEVFSHFGGCQKNANISFVGVMRDAAAIAGNASTHTFAVQIQGKSFLFNTGREAIHRGDLILCVPPTQDTPRVTINARTPSKHLAETIPLRVILRDHLTFKARWSTAYAQVLAKFQANPNAFIQNLNRERQPPEWDNVRLACQTSPLPSAKLLKDTNTLLQHYENVLIQSLWRGDYDRIGNWMTQLCELLCFTLHFVTQSVSIQGGSTALVGIQCTHLYMSAFHDTLHHVESYLRNFVIGKALSAAKSGAKFDILLESGRM